MLAPLDLLESPGAGVAASDAATWGSDGALVSKRDVFVLHPVAEMLSGRNLLY